MPNWIGKLLSFAGAERAPVKTAAPFAAELPDPGEVLKRRGDTLLREGNLEEAASCYRQAIAAAPGGLDSYINLGFVLTEQNRLPEAQQILRHALTLAPQAVDAHYMLGTIARGQGDLPEATERFDAALAFKPDFLVAGRDLYQVLVESGQAGRAGEVLLQLLQRNPQSAEFHFYQANLHAHEGRTDKAIESYRMVLALDPGNADASNNLGKMLQALKRHEEALAHYDRAVQIRPDFADALLNRGIALGLVGKHEQALAAFDALLGVEPNHAEGVANRGNELLHLKRNEAALASYDLALQLQPDNAVVLANRGLALAGLERIEEALASYDAALQIDPDMVEALTQRGLLLRRRERFAEALTSFERALQIRPDHPDTLCYHGIMLVELNRPVEALPSFVRAAALAPDNAGAHFNEGLCRLQQGDLESGWQKFEWRWQATLLKTVIRNFVQPRWSGLQPLDGKRVLVHAEQGYGDTIQFCRYAKKLAALGATVILEVQPGLESLLANVEGVQQILVRDQPLPSFDYHCPLLSLPLAFKTSLRTVPAESSYLQVDAARVQAWGAKLGEKTRPRIGLVWSGSTTHGNDVNRSIPLSRLASGLSDQAHFVSIQKEVRATDLKVLDERKDIAHFGDDLSDFVETAALVSNLDLVITVDTAVAHLAGALGKPVWILLPFTPDWRWMLDRDNSPWYPSATLLRQTVKGDWDSTIASLTVELDKWIRGEYANPTSHKEQE